MTKKKTPYKFDHPLSDEHLTALGMVAVEAAQTEAILELLISQALGVDVDRARPITVPLSMAQRINLVYGLTIPYLHKDEREEFGNLVGAVRSANSDRNDAIHAYWISGTDKKSPVATKRIYDKGKIKFKSRDDLTANQIKGIAARFRESTTNLSQFIFTKKTATREPAVEPMTLLAALLAYEPTPPQRGLFGLPVAPDGVPGLLDLPEPSGE